MIPVPERDCLDGDNREEGDAALQCLPVGRSHRLWVGRGPRHRIPALGLQEPLMAGVQAHPGTKNNILLFLTYHGYLKKEIFSFKTYISRTCRLPQQNRAHKTL